MKFASVVIPAIGLVANRMRPGVVSRGSDESAAGLDQPDDRMQQPVGGRRDAQRFATPHDEAVQLIDLAALAARQILRGR